MWALSGGSKRVMKLALHIFPYTGNLSGRCAIDPD